MTDMPADRTAEHTELVNSFIALANKAGERFSSDFVASAIAAASAAYAVFNAQVDDDEPDLDHLCALYRERIEEASALVLVGDRHD